MASNRTVSFIVVKNFLLLLSFLMLAGSIYVSYASWKALNVKVFENDKLGNRLEDQQLNIWRFITVVTIALQDFTALMGIMGIYKENYELTLTYAITTAIVFIMNLFNEYLKNTIAGPVFVIAVSFVASIFTVLLRSIKYEINDKRSMAKV